MYKRILILLVTVFCISHLQGQNFSVAASQSADWKLVEIPTGVAMAMFREYAYSFEKAVIPINENEVVVSAWHNTLGHALIRVDNAAKVKWKSAVPGYILGTGKWNGNVIAFYTKEWNYKEYGFSVIKEVSAIVFDLGTGKKILDKVVYVNESKNYVQPCVHTRPDGQFSQLMIRETDFVKWTFKNRWSSTGFAIIGLTERLEPLFKHVLPATTFQGEYLGSTVNDKGETFFITLSESKVMMEKLDLDHVSTGKLETEGKYENKGITIRINEKNDQSVIVAMTERDKHKIELALYDFDFTARKVSATTETLDKESVKTWKAQNKEQQQEVVDFKDIDNLSLWCLLQTDEKIILVLEERWTRMDNDGKIAGTTLGPAVVIFFDRKVKQVNSLAIAKEFDIDNRYLISWTMGAHIYDGKLVLVTNDGVRFRTTSPVIVSIDLATMKADKPFYVEKQGITTEGAATIWFRKNFILTNHGSFYRLIDF